MKPYRCKECGEKLPLRNRTRKGRIREYCPGSACRTRAMRKRKAAIKASKQPLLDHTLREVMVDPTGRH